jgi:hypothetical protein
MLGSKANDVISMKRWLAFLEGGLLPIISLTSLHFFTKYDAGKTDTTEVKEIIKEVIVEKEIIKEVPVEVEKMVEVDKIVEVPVIEYVEVDKIVEVEKIVEVPVEVEKIVEVPVEVEKIVERIVEVPVFQPIEDDLNFMENQDELISPEVTVEEPPHSTNRLSYVKP